MKKLFERDKRMYGNTVPKGSMISGSKLTEKNKEDTHKQDILKSDDQPEISKLQKPEKAVKTQELKRFESVKNLVLQLKQGGTVKDGKGRIEVQQ